MTGSEARSPYLRIADDIERRIGDGVLRPGDRVPSTRQITKEWGVAIATATKALAELAARGVVRATPGVGTVVADRSGSPAHTDSGRAPTSTGRPDHHGSTGRETGNRGTGSGGTGSGGTVVDRRRAGPGEVTRERIIQAAIEIADTEGIGVLSMRRIAVDMGVATMSLYRGVSSKDDLLLAMMDHLMGLEEWPAVPPVGWRAQLEYVARRQWRDYQEHPWLAQVVSLTRPQLAPRAMSHTEWVLRALEPYDLDKNTRLYIVLTLFGHVKSAGNGLEAERQAERDTGLDFGQWMRAHDDEFTPYTQSGRYPSLAKLDDGSPGTGFNLTHLFEFGLTTLLNGLAELIEGPQRPR